MIQLFGTAKCGGTRAAERFFAERGVKIHRVDLKVKPMAKGELQAVAKANGGLSSLFDKDGARAKDKGLHLLSVTDDRLLTLLLDDALLLRTPIVRSGSQAAVGIAESRWKAFAQEEKERR